MVELSTLKPPSHFTLSPLLFPHPLRPWLSSLPLLTRLLLRIWPVASPTLLTLTWRPTNLLREADHRGESSRMTTATSATRTQTLRLLLEKSMPPGYRSAKTESYGAARQPEPRLCHLGGGARIHTFLF